MKRIITIVLIIVLLVGALFCLTGCDSKKETEKTSEKKSTKVKDDEIDVESLSDEEKIEHFLLQHFKKVYGKDLDSAKIEVEKMYKAEEAAKEDLLKELNISEKDIAFEVSIDFLPTKGADINQFTVVDGVYDEETGWVHEVSRLGILKYDSKTKSYSIEHLGTGW